MTNRFPREVNDEYWYNHQDISKILDLRLEEIDAPNSVFRMTPVYRGQLETQLRQRFGQNTDDEIILIPYNIGNLHWVGIVLDLRQPGQAQVRYYDPQDNPPPENIQQEIQAAFGENRVVTFGPINSLLRQADGSSCGPLTIENLLNDLIENGIIPGQRSEFTVESNGNNPIQQAKDIRYKHIELNVEQGMILYHYDNKDMELTLEERIKEVGASSFVKVEKPTHVYELENLLRDIAQEGNQGLFFIPYNIYDLRWIGLALDTREPERKKLLYFDTLEQNQDIIEVLDQLMHTIFPNHEVNTTFGQIYKGLAPETSGPLIIETFAAYAYFLINEMPKLVSPEDRKQLTENINKNRPLFYPNAKDTQVSNLKNLISKILKLHYEKVNKQIALKQYLSEAEKVTREAQLSIIDACKAIENLRKNSLLDEDTFNLSCEIGNRGYKAFSRMLPQPLQEHNGGSLEYYEIIKLISKERWGQKLIPKQPEGLEEAAEGLTTTNPGIAKILAARLVWLCLREISDKTEDLSWSFKNSFHNPRFWSNLGFLQHIIIRGNTQDNSMEKPLESLREVIEDNEIEELKNKLEAVLNGTSKPNKRTFNMPKLMDYINYHHDRQAINELYRDLEKIVNEKNYNSPNGNDKQLLEKLANLGIILKIGEYLKNCNDKTLAVSSASPQRSTLTSSRDGLAHIKTLKDFLEVMRKDYPIKPETLLGNLKKMLDNYTDTHEEYLKQSIISSANMPSRKRKDKQDPQLDKNINNKLLEVFGKELGIKAKPGKKISIDKIKQVLGKKVIGDGSETEGEKLGNKFKNFYNDVKSLLNKLKEEFNVSSNKGDYNLIESLYNKFLKGILEKASAKMEEAVEKEGTLSSGTAIKFIEKIRKLIEDSEYLGQSANSNLESIFLKFLDEEPESHSDKVNRYIKKIDDILKLIGVLRNLLGIKEQITDKESVKVFDNYQSHKPKLVPSENARTEADASFSEIYKSIGEINVKNFEDNANLQYTCQFLTVVIWEMINGLSHGYPYIAERFPQLQELRNHPAHPKVISSYVLMESGITIADRIGFSIQVFEQLAVPVKFVLEQIRAYMERENKFIENETPQEIIEANQGRPTQVDYDTIDWLLDELGFGSDEGQTDEQETQATPQTETMEIEEEEQENSSSCSSEAGGSKGRKPDEDDDDDTPTNQKSSDSLGTPQGDSPSGSNEERGGSSKESSSSSKSENPPSNEVLLAVAREIEKKEPIMLDEKLKAQLEHYAETGVIYSTLAPYIQVVRQANPELFGEHIMQTTNAQQNLENVNYIDQEMVAQIENLLANKLDKHDTQVDIGTDEQRRAEEKVHEWTQQSNSTSCHTCAQDALENSMPKIDTTFSIDTFNLGSFCV